MCHECNCIRIKPIEFKVFQQRRLTPMCEESLAIVEVRHIRGLFYRKQGRNARASVNSIVPPEYFVPPAFIELYAYKS